MVVFHTPRSHTWCEIPEGEAVGEDPLRSRVHQHYRYDDIQPFLFPYYAQE